MAALPTTTTAFASSATEAQFKTFLTGQRDYLAGLFGTDGTAATAKSTLGVVAGVSSVNGNTGAISAAQISAAAVASWGYTPPNPSSVAAVSHAHAGQYVPTDAGLGAVGAMMIARPSSSVSAGAAIAGSSLMSVDIGTGSNWPATLGDVSISGAAMAGTWRNLQNHQIGYRQFGLFQRIA